jgi:hypothetical protein
MIAGHAIAYVTLPGETSPVTAGRFELTTDARGISLRDPMRCRLIRSNSSSRSEHSRRPTSTACSARSGTRALTIGAADLIVAEEDLSEATTADRADLTQVQGLLLIGTALGGARPKAVVEDGEERSARE